MSGALGAVLLLVASESARLAPARPAEPQDSTRVWIDAARFWRGGRTTLLEGVVAVATPLAGHGGSGAAAVEMVIRDSGERELHRERWNTASPPRLIPAGAQATLAMPFAVALAPGQYAVEVWLYTADAAIDTVRAEVAAFAEEPLLSDVLLSPAIRVLAEGEEPTGAEIVKGRYAIVPTAHLVLAPDRAQLDYYVELYQPEDEASSADIELELAIRRAGAGGAPLVQTTRTVKVSPPGTPEVGRLDLTGLPPGEYRLEITAANGDARERRVADFAMLSAPVDVVAAARSSAAAPGDLLLERRYFAPAIRDDSVIAALVKAIRLAPPAGSVPEYVTELEPDAQRRFLARYWSRLDPDRTTPENEFLEEYLRRFELVQSRFGEPEIGRAGIDTDRGRIYMRYGPPDATLVRLIGANRGSVDVWRYTRNRNLKFVFLDETGFHNFILVFTNDPNEPSIADWMQRIGDWELIREIETF